MAQHKKRSILVSFRAAYLAFIVGLVAVLHKTNIFPQKQAAPGVARVTNHNPGINSREGILLRKLLVDINETVTYSRIYGNVTESPNNNTFPEEECTEPAYHEFPPDAFSNTERKEGAVVLHIVLLIYMFIALAVVCDVYFVASLDKICQKLNLTDDVAGATFMAAGSSAPELFTSILGVFVAKGDVGVGTIVGSAVFNILFVIGICGLLVNQVVMLAWWPLVRDSAFYSLSVVVLMFSITDSAVQWYEAFIMLIIYALYIVTMVFNPALQQWFTSRIKIFDAASKADESSMITVGEKKYYQTYDVTKTESLDKLGPAKENIEMFSNEMDSGMPPSPVDPHVIIPVDEYVLKSTRKISFEDACFRFMKARGFRPKTRFWAAASIIICERRKLLRDPCFVKRLKIKTLSCDSDATSYTKAVRSGKQEEEPVPQDGWKRLPHLDDGIFNMIQWVVTTPICCILYYTVPDCRLKRWDRWYMVTFLMSIFWIALFSYIMVWMVALVGYTLGIPDSFMGISFLAAGTSVPDAMASVMVARQGQGDMAVSNTIGSNVFDILIGLALPWFIKSAIVKPGMSVHINSKGMVFSVVLLFFTVIVTITSIHLGGWKLDKKLGIICMIAYVVFIIFCSLIEFNVFGYVNAPMCSE